MNQVHLVFNINLLCCKCAFENILFRGTKVVIHNNKNPGVHTAYTLTTSTWKSKTPKYLLFSVIQVYINTLSTNRHFIQIWRICVDILISRFLPHHLDWDCSPLTTDGPLLVVINKGTVNDEKNLHSTLEMKQNVFQSQHVPLFLKTTA